MTDVPMTGASAADLRITVPRMRLSSAARRQRQSFSWFPGISNRFILAWVLIASFSSIMLFTTSYRVQDLEDRVNRKNREIAREHETMQVLRAEWAALSDPARVTGIIKRHSSLVPVDAARIIRSVQDLPAKPPAVEEAAPASSDAKPSGSKIKDGVHMVTQKSADGQKPVAAPKAAGPKKPASPTKPAA
jgi:hypothetical protein